MLIVEGSDRVGKTTLCRKLAKRLGEYGAWNYRHFKKPPARYLWDYYEHMSRHVVQDRFHLSDVVYRIAEGNKPNISPEAYRLVDASLRRLGSVTVVLTADADLIRRRTKLELNADDLDLALKANSVYADLLQGDGYYVIDYDFTYVSCSPIGPVRPINPAESEEFIDRIVNLYMKRQELTREIRQRNQ